jgi:hypothetical protein
MRRFIIVTLIEILLRWIKSGRVRWEGHVACMGKMRNAYNVIVVMEKNTWGDHA